MKLLSFQIRDYKSIIDSGECEMSGENITVLAGQNESGKTSILEALRDFDYSEEISSEAVPDDRDGATPMVDCTFSIDTEDIAEMLDENDNKVALPEKVVKTLLKEGKVTLRKSYPDSYSIVTASVLEAIAEASVPKVETPPAVPEEAPQPPVETAPAAPAAPVVASKKKKTPEEVYTAALVRRSPYHIYFASFDSSRLPRMMYISDLDNPKIQGHQAVKDFLKLAEIDIEHLKKLTDSKRVGNYLEGKSATVTGDFLTYWSQKYDGVNHVGLVAEMNRDDKGDYLSFYVKDARLRKYPEQRSKGFLWFLSFYLRLNAESQDKDDVGAVILIDEPGSYLHSRAQKDILKILKEKITKQKHQVVFSTHSSDLIDPERLNRIRLVMNRKSDGTKVYKTTDQIAKKNGASEFADALSPVVAAIGKDLGADYSIAGRKNVIVEGISDYYYLTTMRKKRGFEISDDIRLIPMTGALGISHMVSIMIGWGLDYVVVMDRDEISNEEYRRLTEELDVPAERILQIEGGKAIEDLFTEKDFKKLVLLDEARTIPAGTHKSDFIRNEKVLLSRQFCDKHKDGTLALEQGTKDKFKAIFDFIRAAYE